MRRSRCGQQDAHRQQCLHFCSLPTILFSLCVVLILCVQSVCPRGYDRVSDKQYHGLRVGGGSGNRPSTWVGSLSTPRPPCYQALLLSLPTAISRSRSKATSLGNLLVGFDCSWLPNRQMVGAGRREREHPAAGNACSGSGWARGRAHSYMALAQGFLSPYRAERAVG